MVADEKIQKGSFVVEYKYEKTFPLSERAKHQEEYEINGEGYYILQAQLPGNKWICLDATRNIECWGRFINHAPGKHANLKMFRPLQVEGEILLKWKQYSGLPLS